MDITDFDPVQISLPAPPQRVHFVGIGGAGVSGLARMLRGMGYEVSGSDMQSSAVTDDLRALGIDVLIGHAAEHVGAAALVVTTAAARDDNPELQAARRASIPVIKRAGLLGRLSLERVCLAVAGTHGKSTTSGMATLALETAGLAPSFAVGAIVRELGANAGSGSGPHFVVEADEYDYSFLWLRPRVAIITNIEYDHPDLFPNIAAVLDAFECFTQTIEPGGVLVINSEDAGCQALLERLPRDTPFRIVTFGEWSGDWHFDATGDGTAHVSVPGGQQVALRLRVPGRHNLRNALAVVAASSGLGVSPEELLPGLERFGGVGRRFEVHLDAPHLVVVDDYAHHPSEIEATIAAARERYPTRRLVVIFQPHTYSRTLALLPAFATALERADRVILAEIYGSRETDSLGVSSAQIAQQMRCPVDLVASAEGAAHAYGRAAEHGDVVVVMGAGDITAAASIIATRASV
ncbi:MAG: UDP-N-acetylmuramate--L-alanine ligase [Chloroflexi bacterium]|nr:MAG: UDP-N-acetylmuramate--L-alanine ligase [Chloroflexota bacterium]